MLALGLSCMPKSRTGGKSGICPGQWVSHPQIALPVGAQRKCESKQTHDLVRRNMAGTAAYKSLETEKPDDLDDAPITVSTL